MLDLDPPVLVDEVGPSLDGPRAKLKRAHTHLAELYGELEEYAAREPSRASSELDPATGEFIARLEVVEPPRNPEWGLLLGDFLTNLRAVLDHLVCQLVLVNGDTPTHQHEFPICMSEEKYVGAVGERARRLRGLEKELLAVIDQSQPFHLKDDAHRHPLAVLKRLSNSDKHRIVHAATTYIPHDFDDTGVLSSSSSEPGGHTAVNVLTTPLFDGTVFARGKHFPASPSARMQATVRLELVTGFGDPVVPAQYLNDIFTFVRNVVRQHRQIFGEQPFASHATQESR